MPPKSYKPKPPGEGRWRPWSAEEMATLRRLFATTTNKDLGELLGRSAKSVAAQGAACALAKSPIHKSRNSRRTALSMGLTPEHMAEIGAKGGKAGSVTLNKSLTRKQRSENARRAVNARWDKVKGSQPPPRPLQG